MFSTIVNRRSRILVPAAAAAALALPAPASAAPVLDPLEPCYVAAETQTQDITVRGNGFTPNAQIDIRIDDAVVATVPADAGGVLFTAVKAPAQQQGERAFTLTAAEQANPAQTVSLQSLVARLAVTAQPKRARPSQRINFRGRGFVPGKPVYAHYVRGGKARRSVRLAAASTGPCGTFAVKRRQFPFKPRVGTWYLQVDQRPDYAAAPGTRVVLLKVRVKRGLKAQPSRR